MYSKCNRVYDLPDGRRSQSDIHNSIKSSPTPSMNFPPAPSPPRHPLLLRSTSGIWSARVLSRRATSRRNDATRSVYSRFYNSKVPGIVPCTVKWEVGTYCGGWKPRGPRPRHKYSTRQVLYGHSRVCTYAAFGYNAVLRGGVRRVVPFHDAHALPTYVSTFCNE